MSEHVRFDPGLAQKGAVLVGQGGADEVALETDVELRVIDEFSILLPDETDIELVAPVTEMLLALVFGVLPLALTELEPEVSVEPVKEAEAETLDVEVELVAGGVV